MATQHRAASNVSIMLTAYCRTGGANFQGTPLRNSAHSRKAIGRVTVLFFQLALVPFAGEGYLRRLPQLPARKGVDG
jgi:hypothetical protein